MYETVAGQSDSNSRLPISPISTQPRMRGDFDAEARSPQATSVEFTTFTPRNKGY